MSFSFPSFNAPNGGFGYGVTAAPSPLANSLALSGLGTQPFLGGLGGGLMGGGLSSGGLGFGASGSLLDTAVNNMGLVPNAMGVTPFQQQLQLMDVVAQQQAQLQQQQQQLLLMRGQQPFQNQGFQNQGLNGPAGGFYSPTAMAPAPQNKSTNWLKWLGLGAGGLLLYKLIQGNSSKTEAGGDGQGKDKPSFFQKMLPFLPALLPIVQTALNVPAAQGTAPQAPVN